MNIELYKLAFELACKELAEHDESELCDKTPISTRGQEGVEEYFLDEATKILEANKETESLKKELIVYQNAIDWLAERCETLDLIANPEYEAVTFKANKWKTIALQKAREHK